MKDLLYLSRYAVAVLIASSATAQGGILPRTADGKPDLQGIWSNATQTPLERPAALGDKGFLTAGGRSTL